MNYKKITATLLTATLVVANVVPAFAAGVDGAGAVEYDNSVDVTYDSITVPTLTGSKYNFTLDPTDKLHTYNPAEYPRESGESNPGVYFKSEKTGAKIEALASDATGYKALFTLSKEAVASDAADWKAVVTAVTDDDNKTPTVTAGYFVWTPAEWTAADLAQGASATGKKGVYTELTASNIKNYFDISEKDTDDKYTITMKNAHLAGDAVCDGKLYKDTYTALPAAGIQDNKPTTDIEEYVETEINGTTKVQQIKTVKNVYVAKDGGGYELAAVANIKFIPAAVAYQATTDKVVVTNKSTKKKTVKAVVTMSNVDGLTFKDADSFTNDATASVFFKATDGTAANDAVLTKGETNATATYTLDIDGADLSAAGKQITYQGGENAKTGGHDYFKYEAVGTTYNSNSFWLVAKANTNSDAAAAWKTYGKTVEDAYDATAGAATPKINIVYTVTDFVAAPTTYTVTYKANGGTGDDQTEDVAVNGNPTGPETAFTAPADKKLAGWATTSDGEAAALNTFTITGAIDLYAIWEDNDIAAVFGTNNELSGTQGTAIVFDITDGKGNKKIASITDVVVELNNGTSKSILTDGVVQTNNEGKPYIAVADDSITISKFATTYMPYDSTVTITYTSVGGESVTVEATFVQAE